MSNAIANLLLVLQLYFYKLAASFHAICSTTIFGYAQDEFKVSSRLTLNLGYVPDQYSLIRSQHKAAGFNRREISGYNPCSRGTRLSGRSRVPTDWFPTFKKGYSSPAWIEWDPTGSGRARACAYESPLSPWLPQEAFCRTH